MPSDDVFYFKFDEDQYASFDETDFIDFNWEDFVKYDAGLEIKLKARNVTYQQGDKKQIKEESEIAVTLIHSKGDAVALSPGGWRPLAFIPNGSTVLFDKNAFSTVKNHIDKNGNPLDNSIKVVVDLFQNRKMTIDPKPILLEGNNRQDKKLPTLEEMRIELGHFIGKMKKRAPNLTIKATEESLEALHKASAIFFAGLDSVVEFIDEAYRYYSAGKKPPKTLEGFKEVLALAKNANVQNMHLIFAAILFKAISGERINPTLKLLKFNQPDFIEKGHAFNGALDIFSLFLFIGDIRRHDHNVYFVTADKDLMHLWNDMAGFIRLDNQPGVMHFDLNYFLPGIEQDDINALEEIMGS
ncbi:MULTISPECIES: hypothetical protein [Pseudomonadaceae]|uniref:hypothetical protein n=1 Tax=Pseudomonadaceae TaxID=135621 RepID=UPI00190CFA9C|nr:MULTISPECIES: hypothetical protein [Pseudomonadaceae]MBK3447551.1 hypothetical protein [Pseudomonas haemolytica]MCQ4322643.1 hypothetical protein [Stutzerimonas stutzeri]